MDRITHLIELRTQLIQTHTEIIRVEHRIKQPGYSSVSTDGDKLVSLWLSYYDLEERIRKLEHEIDTVTKPFWKKLFRK